MIGGIFPVLRLAVQLTQQSAPIAFALAYPHSLGENSTSLCLYQKAAHSGWVS